MNTFYEISVDERAVMDTLVSKTRIPFEIKRVTTHMPAIVESP